jgi:LmbE family N-acetylglucosaminyl deacetylase
MEEHGVDTSAFDAFEEGGAGWPDEDVHVAADVSESIEAKWEALNCHRTQFGPNNPLRVVPEHIAKEMMSHEYFGLASPQSAEGLALAGLFDGL